MERMGERWSVIDAGGQCNSIVLVKDFTIEG